MTVKRSKSATRVLSVIEAIARNQPIGVSDLARELDDDKSAVQRAIMTLADEGWIRMATGSPTRWEMSGHIQALAYLAHGRDDLRQRARPALETLRVQSNETVGLSVPDIDRFTVIEVLECRQMLRMVPAVGEIIESRDSATGRVLLPYFSRERQRELLGSEPDDALLADFETAARQGYIAHENDLANGSITIAAPVFGREQEPIAAVILMAPKQRLSGDRIGEVGAMVARTAQSISVGGAVLSTRNKLRS